MSLKYFANVINQAWDSSRRSEYQRQLQDVLPHAPVDPSDACSIYLDLFGKCSNLPPDSPYRKAGYAVLSNPTLHAATFATPGSIRMLYDQCCLPLPKWFLYKYFIRPLQM